jgi:cell wall-associated NlpC family hydrolase
MIKRALMLGLAGSGALVVAAPLLTVTTLLAVVALPAPVSPAPPAAGDSRFSAIPPSMIRLYMDAAATCAGLSWTVLAAIGTVESDNGQSTLPGVHSGQNSAGAEGPMQFEPATFARYGWPAPPGGADPATPYDPTDAVFAAARMLCANGAPARIRPAVLAFDHSTSYADQVLHLAQTLAAGAGPASGAAASGQMAVAYALLQIGTPYRWGSEAAGVGFDCSGLTQAAWAAAGIRIPRVAQQQFQAGLVLPPSQLLEPGDLVFFAAPAGAVSHVGLYVGEWRGQAIMVDAPHSGADVRLEPFPVAPGASWGGEVFVGATDPSR